MQNQIFCSLCKLKEPSEIFLCPDCGISLCEMCLGAVSNPICICGSSRLKKVGELSAYALQGIFDLQRTLENAVFLPLRQFNSWVQLKDQLITYSPVFEIKTLENKKCLNHIISTMRFVLSNLKEYSTKLRKLFVDVTSAPGFSAEHFQKFQEDLEFTSQDLSFFCERIEDKAAKTAPLLETMQEFAEMLSSQQEILGNAHNQLLLEHTERIRWISKVGRWSVRGRNYSAHVVVTSNRIVVISHYERNILFEIHPNEFEEIKLSRNLLGRKKCLIRTHQGEYTFARTATKLEVLKKQLESSIYGIVEEGDNEPGDFFDSSWYADRFHERIRALLKLTPVDTGRWKAAVVDALRKVSTFVKTRMHDLTLIKRTYQRTLHELVKVETSGHVAWYENRLQEIDEELAELGYLQDVLTDAFSQIDTELEVPDETEKDEWIPNEGEPLNQLSSHEKPS